MAARRPTLPSFALGALAAAAILSTGCATATRVALGEPDRGRIGTARTVANFAQQELAVNVQQSRGGASFGLIGALVDSAVTNSRAKDAEAAVVPVRNALVGYEPGQALGAALGRELAALPWLKENAVEVRQLADSAAVAEFRKGTGADALLLVQTDYRLGAEFGSMILTAKVAMLPGKAFAPPPGAEPLERQPIFFNTVWTVGQLTGFTWGKTTIEEAANLWAANGGEPARRALDDGLAELAAMIAFDLAQGGPPGATSPTAPYDPPAGAKAWTALGARGLGAVQGHVIRHGNGRCWVRAVSGELASTPGCYP